MDKVVDWVIVRVIHLTLLVFSRWTAVSVWTQMFDELLNVRSCSELPDLLSYRKQLATIVQERVTVGQLNSYANQLRRQLCN